MAILKRGTTFNELFIRPIRGLYPDQALTVKEFKDRYERIVKNKWVDTSHGKNGLKIYGLFDSTTDSEIVKENLQEWLCDNCHEVTECISITLRNHERTYTEWFKYFDDSSGPDELALYCLSHKMGIHTAVFNKSYIWTTLPDHVTHSDEEIMQLCGVNLVFLGPTKYGILRDIRHPNSGAHVEPAIAPTPKPSQASHPWNKKTTCHEGTCGCTLIQKRRHGRSHGKSVNQGNRPQRLSESRSQNNGIMTPIANTHALHSSHQQIDYLSLNDGLEEDIPLSPKR